MIVYPIWVRICSFIGIALLGLFPFLGKKHKIGWAWIIPFTGGALALLSVYYIQIPVQELITKAITGSDLSMSFRMFLYILPSGIIQEFFKVLIPLIFLGFISNLKLPEDLWGPFAGAGFGLAEAIYIVGLSNQPIGQVALVERFTAIIFHIALSTIAINRIKLSKLIWTLPLAMILHSLFNYLAISAMKNMNLWEMEAIIGIFALGLWLVAIIVNRNRKSKGKQ